MQIVCIWSSWCHCHPKTPTSLASFKSTLVLPSWYRLTQVILEKRPKNRCRTVVVVVHFIASRNFKAKSTANRHLLTTAVESIAVAALPVPHRPACVQQTSPANSTSAVISHPAADASAYPAATTTNNLFICVADLHWSAKWFLNCLHKSLGHCHFSTFHRSFRYHSLLNKATAWGKGTFWLSHLGNKK